jgi:hypothetical protein
VAYSFAPQSKIDTLDATPENEQTASTQYTFYNFNLKCPALLQWSQMHVAMQGCTATVAKNQVYIKCVVSVPRCASTYFLKWLLQQKNAHKEDSDALSGCLKSNVRLDAPPLIQVVPYLIGSDAVASLLPGVQQQQQQVEQNNVLPGAKMPTDAPHLVIERRQWGQSHGQYLLTLCVASIAVLASAMGLTAACSLAYTRRTRSRIVASTFDALEARRRHTQAKSQHHHHQPKINHKLLPLLHHHHFRLGPTSSAPSPKKVETSAPSPKKVEIRAASPKKVETSAPSPKKV